MPTCSYSDREDLKGHAQLYTCGVRSLVASLATQQLLKSAVFITETSVAF